MASAVQAVPEPTMVVTEEQLIIQLQEVAQVVQVIQVMVETEVLQQPEQVVPEVSLPMQEVRAERQCLLLPRLPEMQVLHREQVDQEQLLHPQAVSSPEEMAVMVRYWSFGLVQMSMLALSQSPPLL